MSYSDFFPYTPRKNQKELMEFIIKKVDSNICIQASSGFGKTAAILSALLPLCENGKRILWTVKTGNETDRPIEELKKIVEKTGKPIFGLSYRGKKDMCLLAKKLEGKLDYSDISFLCKQKRDCKYLKNFEAGDFDIKELLSKPRLYSEILEFCKKEKICPYKLQSELLEFAKVVSLSYNYILNDGMSWGIKTRFPFSSSVLVVDEAHNIQAACQNLNSMKISYFSISRALNEIEYFAYRIDYERIKNIAEKLLRFAEFIQKNPAGEMQIKKAEFAQIIKIPGFEELVISIKKYGNEIKKLNLDNGRPPRSSLFHLGEFLEKFIDEYKSEGTAIIATKQANKTHIEFIDMRSAEILKERWQNFLSCIFCSGTLTPVNAFADTIGLKDFYQKILPSPYTSENAKAFILKGLTTKGSELEKKMAEKYIDSIEKFMSGFKKNIAVFSSSYRIQNELLDGIIKAADKYGRQLFVETQDMEGGEGRRILDEFKSCNGNGLLVATASGRFAEGADFPGKELEGIFLAGIPFDRLSIRTKLFLDYYKKLYGEQKGVFYAYVVPALRRSSQSLGRALRSETDRAVFILADERYAEKRFLSLLPDFISENVKIVENIPENI